MQCLNNYYYSTGTGELTWEMNQFIREGGIESGEIPFVPPSQEPPSSAEAGVGTQAGDWFPADKGNALPIANFLQGEPVRHSPLPPPVPLLQPTCFLGDARRGGGAFSPLSSPTWDMPNINPSTYSYLFSANKFLDTGAIKEKKVMALSPENLQSKWGDRTAHLKNITIKNI